MRRAVIITSVIAVGIVVVFVFLRSRTAVSNQDVVINVGVPSGATKTDAVQHLEQIGATILTNTPELLRAQFKTPGMTKPWQVELGFRDEKLDRVLYIPPEVYLRGWPLLPNNALGPTATAPSVTTNK